MLFEKFLKKDLILTPSIQRALDDDFRKADSMMMKLLLLHWLAAGTVTAFSYGFYFLGLVGGGGITLIAFLAYKFLRGSVYSRVIMGIGMMIFSAIYIQQHLGRIEMHFHVFIALPILMRYKDITPIFAAAVTVALHHLIFSYCQEFNVSMWGVPLKVYNYGQGLDITLLHAVFVVIAGVVYAFLIRETMRQYCTNLLIRAENMRMSSELDVTRRLQQMLLPKQPELERIEDLEIAGFMEPAAEVGGDYYDVIQHQGRVKIGIGDVTGHGLESGVLMLMVQTAVRTLLINGVTDPKQFMEVLNQTIFQNVQRMNSDKNLTLMLLDYHQGSMRISGQHEETLLVRKDGKVERIDTFDLGFIVGLEEMIGHFVQDVPVDLQAGDGLVLYTDGITEAHSPERRMYGVDRLCETISNNWQRSAHEIKDAVIKDVHRHIGNQPVRDDITLVVIKRKEKPA